MPLMVVCLNNQALGSEYYKFDAPSMKAELGTVGSPNLGAVGKAFGGRGRLVRSVDELRSATRDFLLDLGISRNVIPRVTADDKARPIALPKFPRDEETERGRMHRGEKIDPRRRLRKTAAAVFFFDR